MTTLACTTSSESLRRGGRAVVVGLLLAAAGLIGGCRYERRMDSGRLAMEEGRLEAAQRDFQEAYDHVTAKINRRTDVGPEYFQEQQEAKDMLAEVARRMAERGTHMRRDAGYAAAIARANNALKAKNFRAAKGFIAEAAAANPDGTEHRKLAQVIAEAEGAVADADIRNVVGAGKSAFAEGRYEDAVGHFQRARARKPGDAEIEGLLKNSQALAAWSGPFNRGRAAGAGRDWETAAREFREARRLAPPDRAAETQQLLEAAEAEANALVAGRAEAEGRLRQAVAARTAEAGGANAGAAGVTIRAVREEPHALRGDRRGLALHIQVSAAGATGKELRLSADLFDETGKPVPGKLFFRNAEGGFSASTTLKCDSDPAAFEDVQLFLPYDAVPTKGRHSFIVAATCDGKWVTAQPMLGRFQPAGD